MEKQTGLIALTVLGMFWGGQILTVGKWLFAKRPRAQDGHIRAELREQRWYGTTELDEEHVTQGRSRRLTH